MILKPKTSTARAPVWTLDRKLVAGTASWSASLAARMIPAPLAEDPAASTVVDRMPPAVS